MTTQPVRPLRSWFSVFAFLIFACGSLFAADGEKKTFDIPAGPADETLRTFSAQSSIEVVYPSPLVEGVSTMGVKGELTPGEALKQLLAGTGLVAKQNKKTGAYSLVGELDPNVNRAIAESSKSVRREKKSESDYYKNEKGEDVLKMPEYMVTGSKTLNSDIRRTRDNALPYVVYTSQDLEMSQASNLEDFFRSRLSMNTQATANSQPRGTNDGTIVDNTSQIALRGLPSTQTLILVDGRPAPRTPFSGGLPVQADINGIPLSAIERIEILPSTAGGIYGGSAVGGVINIVRKRDYRGLDLRITYGTSLHGGSTSRQFDVTGGLTLGSNTQINIVASYRKADTTFVGDNDLWQKGRTLYAANEPTQLGFDAATPNIRSADGSNLVLDSGVPLNSNHTFVPTGYRGGASDAGAALVANAGRYNLELSDDVYGRRAPLKIGPEVSSGNINIRHQFGARIDAFFDISYGENRSSYLAIPSLTGGYPVQLAANTPNNPFQQAINVYFPLTGLERPAISLSRTFNSSAGLIFRLGKWAITAEYGVSRATLETSNTTLPLNSQGTTALTNGTLDITRDVQLYPLDYSPYASNLIDTVSGPFTTAQNVGTIRLAGPALTLPAGDLMVTSVVESKKEAADASRLLTPTTNIYNPERSQSFVSGYLETTVPVIGKKQGITLLRSVDVQASVRRDDYKTYVTSPISASLPTPTSPLPSFTLRTVSEASNSYTIAMRISPVDDFMLRASHATGFLPPSIGQLVPSGPRNIFLPDPKRGNTFSSIPTLTSGNPNLKPESSSSDSAGVVITPHFIPGLRLSADYTEIQKREEITTIIFTTVLANESAFPGRVTRGPSLSTDQPGWAGPVTLLDDTLFNVTKAKIRAWDFQADYSLRTTRSIVRWYASATLQESLRRQATPISAPFELVGYSDGPLRWRGNLGVDWKAGDFLVGWNTQYYDGYSIRSGQAPTSAASNTAVARQSAELIPSQVYHDLTISYVYGGRSRRFLANTRITAGIQNIFDSRPPAISSPLYGYSSYGDPRLCRMTLSLFKQF